MADRPRLIVGISGASGVIYGVRLLQMLKELPVETHLVMTRTAEVTLAHETDLKVDDVRRLADVARTAPTFSAALHGFNPRTNQARHVAKAGSLSGIMEQRVSEGVEASTPEEPGV